MKTKAIFKYTLITIVGLILLMIVGSILLITLVNPNHYKPLIIQAVDDSTGRKLSLDGDISWKIFPNIGLHIGTASLSNPDGFDKPDLVKIDSMDILVQLLPLLHSSIVVDSINIDGLNLGLIKKGSSNNWTFKSSSKTAATESSQNKIKFELNSLTLKNTTISYADMQTKKQQSLNNFDFGVKTGWNGRMNVDTDKQTFNLDKVNFNLDDILNGQLNLDGANFDNPHYTGDLNLNEFSMNKLLDKLNITKPDLPNKSLLDKVALQTNLVGGANNLELQPINLKFADSTLKGKINISSITPLKLNEDLVLDKADISDFVKTKGYKIPLKQATLSGLLTIPGGFPNTLNANQNIHIQNLTLQGLNLDTLIHQIDLSLENLTNLPNSINHIQSIINKTQLSSAKDLAQTSNLGSLDANLIVHNGVANPAVFRLSGGPSIKSSGGGTINLNQKALNYTVNTQFINSRNSSFIQSLIFPYHLQGKLSNPEGSLDWLSIQRQLAEHFTQEGFGTVNKTVTPLTQKSKKFITNLFGH